MADEQLKTIEASLKQALYEALEEVQATKAALFLHTGDRFVLATQYGFRSNQIRESWDSGSAIPDLLTVRRNPFYVNGLSAEPRLSEMLYDADTTRVLLAPLHSGGRLVGFLDLRDKARQQPFGDPDIAKAQSIANAVIEVLTQKGMYGLRNDEAKDGAADGEIVRLHEPREVAPVTSRSDIVETAQAHLARGALRRHAHGSPPVTDAQVRSAALVLPAIISMPGAVAAMLMPVSRMAGTQIAASRSPLVQDAEDQLQAKVRSWLRKRGVEEPVAARTDWIHPFGAAGPPLGVERLQSVLSAPISRGGEMAMVLSVAFEMNPDARARATLERYLADAEQLVQLADAKQEAASLRQRAARCLLEPDLSRYDHLVEHSVRVSELAEKLALHVGLGEGQAETIRIAALVHDVGMRLLDYERLYRKEQLTTDELRRLRQHPLVGAAVIAESPLGPEIATLVLHHHERPDGTGYPDRLSGDSIPLGSRIIGICEAFDAMTAPGSYQPTVSTSAAVGKIRRSAGEQFDAELAERFAEMMQPSRS